MLPDGRDLVGIIALEKRLGLVREGVADRVIVGETVTPQELAAAEQDAQAIVKRDFYNATTRQTIKPTQVTMSDDQDYDARGQRLAENAVWFSHRGLLAIPLVGDPAFADADRALSATKATP
jgi:hypothetical protein